MTDRHRLTVDMSPERAQIYLSYNARNRYIRAPKLRQYIEAMRRGEWDTFADPGIHLGQLPSGELRLLNGQHRLKALIEANITIQGMVVHILKVKDEAELEVHYARFDQGANRSVSDVLSVQQNYTGKPSDLSVITTALSAIELWVNGTYGQFVNSTVEQRVAIFNKYHADALGALEYRSRARFAGKRPTAGTMMAYIQTRRLAPAHAELFWEQVSSGTNLDAKDPAYLLREQLTRAAAAISLSGRGLMIKQYAKCTYAWNLFAQGRQATRIQVQNEDPTELKLLTPRWNID